jgi:hypothetical protein
MQMHNQSQQQQQQQHIHALTCPHCHSDQQVQKVSAIVASGTVNGTMHGIYWGRVGGIFSGRSFHGNTIRWHHQQTELAERLAPPRKPRNLAAVGTILGVFCFALPLVCGCPQSLATAGMGIVGGMLALGVLGLCVAAIVGMIVAYQRGVPGRRMRHMEWQRQMSKWDALYYCHRCDGVFAPGVTPLLPTYAMRGYLVAP